MSLWNRAIVPAVAVLFLSFLGACGSGLNRATPPPSGAFSPSNLSGTYVFSVAGSDAVVGDLIAMAGTMTADGNGNITGGTFDVNNPNGAGLFPLLTINSGSTYRVTVDGRGTATIQTSQGTFGFAFVLTSSTHGLITEFDNNGTASGSLDLQATVAQGDIAGGSFAFTFTGTSGSGSTICGVGSSLVPVIPFATIGAFTLDSNGNVASGVEDFNNNCSSSGQTNLPITGGFVDLTNVPGTASLTSNAGTFTFDVYPIDKTHLKFIEIDSLPVTSGEAFAQSTSIPTGNNVFTLAGFDANVFGPFTAAGLLVTDGAGGVTSGSTEDINDVGNALQVTGITGTYGAVSGGRSVLTLNAFDNGANGLTGSYQFAAYPSSGGLQLLEIDNLGITSGVAYTQTSTTVASGEGYGLNLTGSNGGEEDDIAEFTNTNGNFSGLVDFNDMGSLTSSQKFSATYTADGTVSGRGTVVSNNAFNLVTYVVDTATTIFVEVDTGQVGLGAFQVQNASAKSNLAATHLAVLRSKLGAMKAFKRRQGF